MITVPKIQLALRKEYFSSTKLAMPNIFLFPPFESDFLRVTKSGYPIEYEIKLSKSDFKADFKKSKDTGNYILGEGKHNGRPVVKWVGQKIKKHEWLLSGNGPSEFYYVFPKGLIKYEDIPEWCGIIEVREYTVDWKRDSITSIDVIRAGKRLNKTKLSENKISEMYKACYYRFWDIQSKRNSDQILML